MKQEKYNSNQSKKAESMKKSSIVYLQLSKFQNASQTLKNATLFTFLLDAFARHFYYSVIFFNETESTHTVIGVGIKGYLSNTKTN